MTTAMFGFLLIAIITGKFHDLWKAKVSFSVIMGGVSIGLSLGFYIFVDSDDVDCKRSLLDLHRSFVLRDFGPNLP